MLAAVKESHYISFAVRKAGGLKKGLFRQLGEDGYNTAGKHHGHDGAKSDAEKEASAAKSDYEGRGGA